MRNRQFSMKNYEDEYIKDDFENIQVYYRQKKIIEFLESYRPSSILEIGCGMVPIFLSYKHFAQYVLVEPSELFFLNAKRLAEENSLSAFMINDYFENSIDCLKSISFDIILISGLLHEVSNPTDIVKQLATLCRKSTIVHANVPNAHSFHRQLAVKAGMINSIYDLSESNIRLQQTTVFDIDKLLNLFRSCDFFIIDSGSYFIKPFTHKQMNKMFAQGILTHEMLEGLYNLTLLFPESGSEIYVNCKLSGH